MIDGLKRASAGRVTAAIPYFGYARQDRRPRSARVAISAKVAARIKCFMAYLLCAAWLCSDNRQLASRQVAYKSLKELYLSDYSLCVLIF